MDLHNISVVYNLFYLLDIFQIIFSFSHQINGYVGKTDLWLAPEKKLFLFFSIDFHYQERIAYETTYLFVSRIIGFH